MKAKDVRLDGTALKSVIAGVNILAKAVGSTLGPGGRNVIYKSNGWPYITKDGVTVARNIALNDEFENIGVQLVKDVANRTCKDAGDGTTTSTILAAALLEQGFQYIEHGVNPIDIQRSINKAVDIVVSYIENNIRKEISDNHESIKNIATVSANWDEEIGNIVGEAVSKVGLDGAIHIDKSHTTATKLNLVEGINFDRGFDGTSPYFITDSYKHNCEFENPYILLYKGTLKSFRNLIPLLEQVMKNSAELVIIADNYEPDVLSSLVANKQNGKLKVAAIKAPHFAELRMDTMNDLAFIYNTEVIDEQFGNKILAQVSLNELGRCSKAVINAKGSSFIGVNKNQEAIDEYIEQLKTQRIGLEEDSQVYKNISKRIAQLTGYIATIYIGGVTEVEYEEKFDRVDDALRATRSAIEEGIVPGGSYSYLKASNCEKLIEMENNKNNVADSIGAAIVRAALLRPFLIMCRNAGIRDLESYKLQLDIWKNENNGVGFNIKSRNLENLWESGVIDPFKVTRTALQNAASIAGLTLTTSVIIGEYKEDEHQPPINTQPPSLF
jgi:chaperonin GroEL